MGRSGFDDLASELLRADALPFTFTQRGAEPVRARADLEEAIAVMVAGPAVSAALADATAAMQARFTQGVFARQVALVHEREALQARLANLMMADQDDETPE